MSWFGFDTHHARWELRTMRLLFALVLFWGIFRPPVAAMPHPHGVAHLVDLTFLADPQVFAVLKSLLIVPLALFVWGRWMAVSLTFITAFWIGSWTLIESQGAIGHGSQIAGLVLLAMWLAYVVGPWLRRREGVWARRPDLTLDDLAIYWVHQVIAAAYVVAGVSKLTTTGFQLVPFLPRWLVRVQYIPVQITKTHEEEYYAFLDPEQLERAQVLGDLFALNPDLTRFIFSGGLVLELLAFLLLIDRRWAAGMGVALIMMHVMISLTMNLHFTMNIWVALIFLINVPYWLAQGARGRSVPSA